MLCTSLESSQAAIELLALARMARRSIEPGLARDDAGRLISQGACLHACVVVAVLLRRFSQSVPTVRGGSAGALDTCGQWRGHYWIETTEPSGARFVVDVTADQFGHEAVVVLPLDQASGRYRPGPQSEVAEAFSDLAAEFNCLDLLQPR